MFTPAAGAGDAQLVVLGSTRLESFALASGEPRWWVGLASNGAIGTAVAHGDTLIVSTASSSEPWMEKFETLLAKLDTDKDGRLSRQEFSKETDGWAEHFGWIDGYSRYRVRRGINLAPTWASSSSASWPSGRQRARKLVRRPSSGGSRRPALHPVAPVYDGRFYL